VKIEIQVHYCLKKRKCKFIVFTCLVLFTFLHLIIILLMNQGLIHDIFTQILRGLSGSKVTKPGKFRSSQDGYAVKSSLKAEDGLLYPLEKSFFFLPKPPTLILHEEVNSNFCKAQNLVRYIFILEKLTYFTMQLD